MALGLYYMYKPWLYHFSIIFAIWREQFRSRVLWHGRFGMFPTPTLGATCLERVTPPRFRSRVPWWHFYYLRLHSSDLEFCVGLFYATAWFRSRVPWRIWWFGVAGAGVAGEGTVLISSSVALVMIFLRLALYDFSYWICLAYESSRWDDTPNFDITIG
jgi:hypothetical protein